MNMNTKDFRAVSIRSGDGTACAAFTEIKDQRFLCNQAPMLPLPDCTNPSACKCIYQHLDDRRQEDRRAEVTGIGDQYFASEDRRETNRRSS